MTYAFIGRACSDLPVAACCRVMKVSTSGFYAWRAQPASDRDWDDAVLTSTIVDIHQASRRSYGSPRVHAELVLGEGIRCSRKRVERLMRQAGIAGIHRRRHGGCTHRDGTEPSDDLVKRSFDPDEPDRLWVTDVTEHPTDEGKVYLAVVLDAFSRRVVGWSIADHMRAELVVDAVQMAIWRRRPPDGQTIAHSDHGSQGSTRRGPTAGGSGPLGCSGPWAPSATASTTAWPRASSAPSRSSSSTNTTGPAASTSPSPSSTDRSLVRPPPPPLLLRHAQPHRLRDHPRGMITLQPTRPQDRGRLKPATRHQPVAVAGHRACPIQPGRFHDGSPPTLGSGACVATRILPGRRAFREPTRAPCERSWLTILAIFSGGPLRRLQKSVRAMDKAMIRTRLVPAAHPRHAIRRICSQLA
ncbi:MAG: IS3 family transposase [Iamia sp.]